MDNSEKSKKIQEKQETLLTQKVLNPVWLSVSESAKIGGVTTKTIRRAIQGHSLSYKVVKNRYLLEVSSVIRFLHTKTKLKNKLNEYGIGQYVKKWLE